MLKTEAPFTGVRIRMEIFLPQLFELMSQPDPVELRKWFVTPGDTVQPGDDLVEVWAPGRRITIPTPPELVVPHRVVEIAKSWPLYMGDFLIKLEPVESSSSV
jgi:hypothetical protein